MGETASLNAKADSLGLAKAMDCSKDKMSKPRMAKSKIRAALVF